MCCPACGFEHPSGMGFCGQSTTRLAVSPALGEELKIVTVLFVDVGGSTCRSGMADPERVRAVIGGLGRPV